MDAPELQNKITISWQLLLSLLFGCLALGGTITKVLSQAEEIEQLRTFLLGEVDGHRADENRRYTETIDPRFKRLEERIQKLEK